MPRYTRAISRNQPNRDRSAGANQGRFQIHPLAHQRVVSFGPYSGAIELSFQAADVADIPAVNRYQTVAQLNAGLLAGTVSVHPGCPQVATVFHPPNSIVGGRKLTLLLEVDPGEHDCRHAEERQDNGKKTRL